MPTSRRARPLATPREFAAHVARNSVLAIIVVAGSLSAGAAGYHFLGHLPWIDACLNASMILTGMGPVDRMDATAGKLFATVYALFSGLAFLLTAALILTPLIRRVFHRLHLDMYGD